MGHCRSSDIRFALRGAALIAIAVGSSAQAEVETGSDNETGLRYWLWRERGVSVRLVQRLPDQTRGFFLARGFTVEQADIAGRACVFQTIFRNDGAQPVAYTLADWHVRSGGKATPLLVREHWEKVWEAKGVAIQPRVAFRWALLPTTQQFEPGDYNWGMTSFGLPPGATFDLSLAVTLGGRPVQATIEGIVCAEDR